MPIGWMRGRRAVVIPGEADYLASGSGTAMDPHGTGDFAYLYAAAGDPSSIETANPLPEGQVLDGVNVVMDGTNHVVST